MCSLITRAGLHLNGCIHRVYHVIEFCTSLPSKYILIFINTDSTLFEGRNMGCFQSVANCARVRNSVIQYIKVQNSAIQYRKMQKMQRDIDNY